MLKKKYSQKTSLTFPKVQLYYGINYKLTKQGYFLPIIHYTQERISSHKLLQLHPQSFVGI